MFTLFIAIYILGFILALIWMGYGPPQRYDNEDYAMALVWPIFIIMHIAYGYIWFCEKMVSLGRRLYNGSSKK